MKKLTSLLLALMLLLTAVPVLAEDYVFDPYEIMGRTDLDINQKFKSNTVYFNATDLDMLFLDVNIPDQKSPYTNLYDTYPNAVYQYNLEEGALVEKNGVVYISLDELKKVYGYGTKFEADDGATTFYYRYNDYLFYDPSNGTNPTQVWKEDVVATYEIIVSGIKAGATELTVSKAKLGEEAIAETVSLTNAVVEDGALYVPFVEFAEKAWGKTIVTQGNYIAISNVADVDPDVFAEARIAQMDMALTDDTYAATGNRWFVYYNETVNKLMPYQVYVPANYDPSVPTKFIMQLHGGSGNENAVLSRVAEGSGIAIEPYADKYNYMIMLPNAIISSSWGDKTSDDPAQQAVIYAAEKGVYASLFDCFEKYNVDTNALFVQGNSMGSSGTIYFATNDTRFRDECGWTYEFRAAAPAGGSGFKANVSIPMIWIWGERDSYANRVNAYNNNWSEEYKALATCITVEHGHHSWAHSGSLIKAVYEFFDSILDGTYGQEANYVKADFTAGSKIAKVTDKAGNVVDFEMANEAILSGYNNDVVMVALEDLSSIFGPAFKAYEILDNKKIGWNFYGTIDPDINGGQGLRTYRNTYVLIYGNKTMNIEMDINKLGGGTTTYSGDPMTEVVNAVYAGEGTTFTRLPDFTVSELPAAPIGNGTTVYVPVYEVLSALGMQ